MFDFERTDRDTALHSKDDVRHRLVMEHCCAEARGLDVLPNTIAGFRRGGDNETADLLENEIYPDEVTHVEAGLRFFLFLETDDERLLTCSAKELHDIAAQADEARRAFKQIVVDLFGTLKPPFNVDARTRGGLPEDWFTNMDEVTPSDKATELAGSE